ncbi:unnamed protein product [Rotaria magnacalcarata]|uniref:Nose resistant-to-fluoxetine protein N-terminal domain-containing protein n=1 Tax=Rotaria magnacalcarata TaxID=392030 RepID=A0A815LAP2_9BILA|nr:unnamed protein product [Rotaria magnacalcarata]CAF1463188.1 unnamed protein product [Rotaria magnacalcarata]CAF2120496.1 unnamed protein product [Rotaria magnacalcarata]CAF2181443.1 unnamed protein product [Rotaria magnacalcarata]
MIKFGIKAESLSSINLIPKIIANARFVQENFVDFNMEFNQTLPWIKLDPKLNSNESNCSRDIALLTRDLVSKQTWALKTLDAWGKLPSGIMQGNIFWIGSTYECEHHLRGLNNTVVEQPIRTRTCIISSTQSITVRPIYGICVPQSCNENELINYINQHAIRIPFIKNFINLKNDSMHCLDQRSYDANAILTIVFLSVIAFLILVATGMHIAYRHKHVLKMDETPATTYEPILSRTTTAVSTSQTQSSANEQENEATPLIARPQHAADSMAQNLINCCSLISSYPILNREHQPKILSCLNGIRVLSLWWIIIGHTFLYAAYYSDNVLTIFNWSRQLWFQIIVQGVLSVDSFFVLSGLLTTFIFFVMKVENERVSIGKFLLNHYVYRYIRYTVFYAIILLIHINLSSYLGQGGPVYPVNGSETSTCRQTWWRNLLYINNFFDMKTGCMPITWFLAVYMQFHWISPLYLLTVSWNWVFGMLVAVAFILVDIITTAVIVSKNNYDHGIFGEMYSTRTNGSDTTHDYSNDVYIKPWCRIAPYAVGLILGYVLYEIYKRANAFSWDSLLPQTRVTRFNRVKYIIAWLCALTLLVLCIFGTYGDFNGHPLNRSERIAFLTLSRLAWAIGLGIVIVICFTGYGGIVDKFLAHPFFESLGKLTYGAYLWHSLVVFVDYLSRDQAIHYTIMNIICGSILHITIAYILSLFTFLFVELPVIQLLKLAFKRPTFHN